MLLGSASNKKSLACLFVVSQLYKSLLSFDALSNWVML
jgi:hypothetical protein